MRFLDLVIAMFIMAILFQAAAFCCLGLLSVWFTLGTEASIFLALCAGSWAFLGWVFSNAH
jgi:hypothetical protein